MTPALVPFNTVPSTGVGEVRGGELGGMAGEEADGLGAEVGVLARSWAIEIVVAALKGLSKVGTERSSGQAEGTR